MDLLDLLGRGYVLECCISAANFHRARENFEIYLSDAAYVLMKAATNGKIEIERYYDITHPKPIDDRSGEEIADDVVSRLGLKVVG